MMVVKHSALRTSSWEPLTGALDVADALIVVALCALVLVLVFTVWAWPMSSGEK